MPDISFGHVTESSDERVTVDSQYDLSARGPAIQRVVLEARAGTSSSASAWMQPYQARQLAAKLLAAAEHAEAVNAERVREEAEEIEYERAWKLDSDRIKNAKIELEGEF